MFKSFTCTKQFSNVIVTVDFLTFAFIFVFPGPVLVWLWRWHRQWGAEFHQWRCVDNHTTGSHLHLWKMVWSCWQRSGARMHVEVKQWIKLLAKKQISCKRVDFDLLSDGSNMLGVMLWWKEGGCVCACVNHEAHCLCFILMNKRSVNLGGRPA